MLDAIEQIEKYAVKGREAFERDELIQSWIVRHIQIIGEAAAGVVEHTQQMHPEIPWRQIVAMRNILVHAYFRIDIDEVWGVVERDIPTLKKLIKAALAAM